MKSASQAHDLPFFLGLMEHLARARLRPARSR